MTSSLLQRLGIALPIIQGPMTGSDTPALAAAVSAAGGLGMLGCGMRSPAAMAEAAAAVRQQTDRPFGMNLFVQATPNPDEATVQAAMERLAPLYAELGLQPQRPTQWCEDFAAQFEVLVALRPAVASFTFGILDAAQVARLHAAGCLVVGTATTVAEARAWAQVGADVVCASGTEAGGHRGTFLGDFTASQVGTLALVPQCVDAVDIPVIAAGGIMDGRGIAAAQALGAQAVQMGTAFLACPESGIGPAYRQALAQAQDTDTRLTRVFSGRPARGIVNRVMRELGTMSPAAPAFPLATAAMAPLRAHAEQRGSGDFSPLWAGQNASGCQAVGAAELTRALAAGLAADAS